MGFSTASIALAWLSILTFAAGEAFAADKRVALVIGNSAYTRVTKLPNPSRDAAAVAALLTKAGFDVVESRQDLNISDMRRVIDDFSNKLRDADIAVVFYAGHGIEVGGANYLVPVDAALARDIDVEDEALSLERIVSLMEPVKRLRLVILDACRDNPFIRSMKRTEARRSMGPGLAKSRSIGRGLAKVEVSTSDTLIAFAAKAGSTAADGDGRNSPFTTALLNNLTTPGLDIRLAFGRVRDEVLKITGSRQEPFVYGSLGGTTVALVAPDPEHVVAAPAIDIQAAMRRDYQTAERIGTKEAWDQFLVTYPTGFHAGMARAARAKIAAEETKAAKPERPAMVIASATLDNPVGGSKLGDNSETARRLQSELRRVGCYTGAVNGDWSSDSRRALELFTRHTGLGLEVKVASLDALDAVRGKSSRICPLKCAHGYKADADACIKISCPKGQFVGDDNTCERPKQKPQSASKLESRKGADAGPAPSRGGSKVICGKGGCQDVKVLCVTGGGRTIDCD